MKLPVRYLAMIQSIKDTLPQIAYNFQSNFSGITCEEAHPMNDWGVIYNEDGYPIDFSEVRHRARLFVCAWTTIKQTFQLCQCAIVGHEFRDDSYGDPEGGCIDLTCTRCGYGLHHTLY